MEMTIIETKEDARSKAIDFQSWTSTQSFSYEDSIKWARYFTGLASQFGLYNEFKENGII